MYADRNGERVLDERGTRIRSVAISTRSPRWAQTTLYWTVMHERDPAAEEIKSVELGLHG